MIAAFVVDASMAIAWVHPAQATDDSDAWLGHVDAGAELIVPAMWPFEVSNAHLALQRRRKLTPGERDDALRSLRELPVVVDPDGIDRALTELADRASAESLSVYDASYLELAVRRHVPLAAPACTRAWWRISPPRTSWSTCRTTGWSSSSRARASPCRGVRRCLSWRGSTRSSRRWWRGSERACWRAGTCTSMRPRSISAIAPAWRRTAGR